MKRARAAAVPTPGTEPTAIAVEVLRETAADEIAVRAEANWA